MRKISSSRIPNLLSGTRIDIALESVASSPLERRAQPDRRSHSLRTLTYCGLRRRGRRRYMRRQGYDYYLDWYDPDLVVLAASILLLCCLDALFTLTLLQRGAVEANYFMAQLIETDVTLFAVVKMTVTALGLLFLLMHAHFRVFQVMKGKQLLLWILPVYVALIGYELILLLSY